MIRAPFYRIGRFVRTINFTEYIHDNRYASDKMQRILVYHAIEQDLKKLLTYINPDNRNSQAYSTKTFELLLRAATEFESNCKAILQDNQYNLPRKPSMDDYKRINQATQLSEYQVKINIWKPQKTINPLEAWGSENSLAWYKAYNLVKHDRSGEFHQATLDNVIYGVASVFCILFAQFAYLVFDPYQETDGFTIESGFCHRPLNLFSVKPFTAWRKEENYNPHWHPKDGFQEFFFK